MTTPAWAVCGRAMGVLFVATGAIIGCSEPDGTPMLSPSLSELRTPGSGEVNVVVLGQGRFIVDGGGTLTSVEELQSELQARRIRADKIVIYVHEDLDESAKGFNSLLAMNAAALAGYEAARGYDGFNEEGRASGSMLRPLPAISLEERAQRLRGEMAADTQPHQSR